MPPQNQKPKRPRGRPKVVIDYEKVTQLAARGMDKKHIAACLGMGVTTLCAKQNEDPLFKEAMDRGMAQGISAVTGQLLKCINLGNVTAIIFYLKAKAGWRETSIVLNGEIPVLPDDQCTAEEAEAAYIAAMRLSELK